MNIEKIPTEELKRDRRETLYDIRVCRKALEMGFREYSGGSIRERLDVNCSILVKIEAELYRRKEIIDES